MARIVSIQIGQTKTYMMQQDGRQRAWQTAFDKQPISTAVKLHEDGLTGDMQADRKNHGGPDKAVLMYALAHYESWRGQYPELTLDHGAFGENLTMESLDETNVCIGDIYQLNQVVVEVAQPRIPCWKISERWQTPGLTDAVRSSGRTGWYVRVKRTGMLVAGQSVELMSRPHPELTIQHLNDLLFGRKAFTAEWRAQLQHCSQLADAWKRSIPQR